MDKNKTIIINNSEAIKLLDVETDYISLIEESLKYKKESILPPKVSMVPFFGAFQTVMPVMIHKLGISGFKYVTRYPQRNPSLNSSISLYSSQYGNKIAEIESDYITNLRTGAVAAHSIELLAISNYSVVSFIGLGAQAKSTIKVLFQRIKNRKIKIKLLRYKDQHVTFIQFIKELEGFDINNVEFEIVDSYIESVKGADVIISSITYADEELCDEKYFKEGSLLVPIHTRGFYSCDTAFDKVYGDDYDHLKNFRFFNEFKSFSEVSEVIYGQNPGRQNEKERILVYNVGIALHDLYFAYICYNNMSL